MVTEFDTKQIYVNISYDNKLSIFNFRKKYLGNKRINYIMKI